MKSFWTRITFFTIICCSCKEAKKVDHSSNVPLVLVISNATTDFGREDSGKLCGGTCAKIQYSIKNIGSTSYLLYNLHGNIQMSDEEPELNCDSLWGPAVTRINVYDSDQRFIAKKASLVQGDRDIKRYEMWKDWFRKGMVAIKSGEEIQFSEIVDFEESLIDRPSRYKISLVYVQFDREGLEWQLPKEQIDADLKSTHTTLFKGCLFSNQVELVVR